MLVLNVDTEMIRGRHRSRAGTVPVREEAKLSEATELSVGVVEATSTSGIEGMSSEVAAGVVIGTNPELIELVILNGSENDGGLVLLEVDGMRGNVGVQGRLDNGERLSTIMNLVRTTNTNAELEEDVQEDVVTFELAEETLR